MSNGDGHMALDVIGTLGSPQTFAGQATDAWCEVMGARPERRYYPSMDDVWRGLASEEVDGIVLTAESTHVGMTDVAARVLWEPELQVWGEVVLPYHCALLGKPGTDLRGVRQITGHGSLVQCRGYLRKELPSAKVAVHPENSGAAAREVLEGDGSLAVVGTLKAAEQLGLAVLARDIDDGSEGSWWIIGRKTTIPSSGTSIVAQSMLSDDVWPGAACGSAPRWRLRSLLVEPSHEAIFSYETLAVLTALDGGVDAVPPEGWRVRGRFNTAYVR